MNLFVDLKVLFDFVDRDTDKIIKGKRSKSRYSRKDRGSYEENEEQRINRRRDK